MISITRCPCSLFDPTMWRFMYWAFRFSRGLAAYVPLQHTCPMARSTRMNNNRLWIAIPGWRGIYPLLLGLSDMWCSQNTGCCLISDANNIVWRGLDAEYELRIMWPPQLVRPWCSIAMFRCLWNKPAGRYIHRVVIHAVYVPPHLH